MSRYDQHQGRVATTIFEAAAWHYALKPTCSHCGHSANFRAHGLWWHFEKRNWDGDLRRAVVRFWCRECRATLGRVRPKLIEVVRESELDFCLPMPPEREWKRALNRMRN